MNPRKGAIACRQCDTVFPLGDRSCPECATRVRSRVASTAVVAIGLLVLYVSLSPFDGLSAAVGLILLAVGAHVFRDRRRRIRAARERLEGSMK